MRRSVSDFIRGQLFGTQIEKNETLLPSLPLHSPEKQCTAANDIEFCFITGTSSHGTITWRQTFSIEFTKKSLSTISLCGYAMKWVYRCGADDRFPIHNYQRLLKYFGRSIYWQSSVDGNSTRVKEVIDNQEDKEVVKRSIPTALVVSTLFGSFLE